MRPYRLIGLTAGLLAGLAVHASAADPYESNITANDVEVRSGPSLNFYPTSKLARGARVKVVEEKEGWLAIEPPDGSFSWINNHFIKRNRDGAAAPGEIASVFGEQVPIRIGSSLARSKPTVIGGHLSSGAQVVILGPPLDDVEDGRWWPIRAMPSEMRYIPKDAVQGAQAPVQVTNKPGDAINVAPAWNQPSAGARDPLEVQAEELERANRLDEAARVYDQLYAKWANSDHRRAVVYSNRAAWCRNGNRGGSVHPAYQSGRPNTATYSGQPNRLVPQATSNYGPAGTPLQGTLRATPYGIDNKVAYLLDGPNKVYVTEGPGVKLSAYVGRYVTLTGSQVNYRSEFKNYHMEAYSVR